MSTKQVRIVTDTTAVLPPEYIALHKLEVVPQVVLFGEESFLEDVEISYAEFIRRLKTSNWPPKTAAPPPGLFIEAYERQLVRSQTIISIHPSIDVSGTLRSALTAKEVFANADIRVLDTRSVAGNLATMVMLAVEWAESGMPADEIMARLQAMIPRGRTYFLVATLEYLQKGGRIGGAAALIGSALQIKPILEFRNGRVEPLERVRTYNHALDRLKALVVEHCPPLPQAYLSVMQADDMDEAQRLVADLKAALRVDHIPIYNMGASITTHAGPGTLAAAFFTQEAA